MVIFFTEAVCGQLLVALDELYELRRKANAVLVRLVLFWISTGVAGNFKHIAIIAKSLVLTRLFGLLPWRATRIDVKIALVICYIGIK